MQVPKYEYFRESSTLSNIKVNWRVHFSAVALKSKLYGVK